MSAVPILLVEDNPDDQWLFRRAADRIDLSIDLMIAQDGNEAIEMIRARRPALVITDLKMPGCDGIELLTAIRADPQLLFVPVLVWTTSRARNDVERAYTCGCNAFLIKPMQFRELVAMLQLTLDYWTNYVTTL